MRLPYPGKTNWVHSVVSGFPFQPWIIPGTHVFLSDLMKKGEDFSEQSFLYSRPWRLLVGRS